MIEKGLSSEFETMYADFQKALQDQENQLSQRTSPPPTLVVRPNLIRTPQPSQEDTSSRSEIQQVRANSRRRQGRVVFTVNRRSLNTEKRRTTTQGYKSFNLLLVNQTKILVRYFNKPYLRKLDNFRNFYNF